MSGGGMIPVSVVVLTKNEESNIGKCLDSLIDVGEVFVVDSGSTDRTLEIAERRGAKIAYFTWNRRYPKKKQWSLENLPIAFDWVLFVDADEEVTVELRAELEALFRNEVRQSGFFVRLNYRFMGRVLRHGQAVYKLVLFDRHRGRFVDYDDLDVANMWEVEGHYQPQIDGAVSVLGGRLLHDDHASLFEYFARHNRYSDWEAILRAKRGLVSDDEALPPGRRLMKRGFAALPMKSLLFFVYAYVFRLGFLDGRAGFHYAIAKSFYYWQIGLKERESQLSDLNRSSGSDEEWNSASLEEAKWRA
jgi:glycosyltransferase involved in cell wall biosynthesis